MTVYIAFHQFRPHAPPQVIRPADELLVQPVLECDSPKVDLHEHLHLLLHVPRMLDLLGDATLLRLLQLEPHLLHEADEESVLLHLGLQIRRLSRVRDRKGLVPGDALGNERSALLQELHREWESA